MSKAHPDFTDVVYAKARARGYARKGLRLSEAGDKKGARVAYQEALRWSKEAERLEKVVRPKKPADRTSRRARRKPSRR